MGLGASVRCSAIVDGELTAGRLCRRCTLRSFELVRSRAMVTSKL